MSVLHISTVLVMVFQVTVRQVTNQRVTFLQAMVRHVTMSKYNNGSGRKFVPPCGDKSVIKAVCGLLNPMHAICTTTNKSS